MTSHDADSAMGNVSGPDPESTGYRLIDFGEGAKLEAFGSILVRRPSPVADGTRNRSQPWDRADLIFEKRGREGRWQGARPGENWSVCEASVRLKLKPTPFGHLGVFPEQIQNWRWIRELPGSLHGLEALNLFAYTGGTTLALARRGVRVTHVDSAQPVVRWARRNAELNGLSDAPVRWIVEDAIRYVERELRRGRRYDIIVADPPAFGHGPRKQGWDFHRDLPELMVRLGDLSAKRTKMILVTGHTPGVSPASLADMIADAFADVVGRDIDNGPMQIAAESGRTLPAGYFARYWAAN